MEIQGEDQGSLLLNLPEFKEGTRGNSVKKKKRKQGNKRKTPFLSIAALEITSFCVEDSKITSINFPAGYL